MQIWSWDELVAYRARVRGCLLGGAIGDALGNPVEFLSLNEIRARHGQAGVTGLVAGPDGVAGLVTDDTQMTLFTLEGLSHEPTPARVREAYLRWLDTQENPIPPDELSLPHRVGTLRLEQWLYARRAPGMACLSGLRARHVPDLGTELDGAAGPVNPHSKGCGTVMRAAPFGFATRTERDAFELAAKCAQITHGHPTGYYAAGAFAAVVHCLLEGDSLPDAVVRATAVLVAYPGHEETSSVLRRAVELAAVGNPVPEAVETLGEGWVAEEALAIAVYAALAGATVEDAFLLSVNHSGDSDSTGAVCGNLLGALHGDLGLPPHWLAGTEGRATIAVLADDFATAVRPA